MLDMDAPPQSVKLRSEGLMENPDGLYPLDALLNRFDEAICAYDQLSGAALDDAA